VQKENKMSRPDFDFIALAIRGKKIGFESVIKMIDNLIRNLKQEQVDDDHKKVYCGAQFDETEDKKKGLDQTIEDHETAIEQAEESMAALKEEIKMLEGGIKALDKSVAEASEQRKAEHTEFTELMSSNAAAKELLHVAINRLNKFYNPALFNPPKREFAEAALLQISRERDAPAPPPETYGAYSKKTEETGGVVQMIKNLVKELDKEMTEAETQEHDSQKEYEDMTADSAEKRAADTKSLNGKKSGLATTETQLVAHNEAKKSSVNELGATMQFLQSLHVSCDWLLKYHDMRSEARASEVDALGKAKAVLSGADYSFLQSKM
jgi:chromosome segregation ATPase